MADVASLHVSVNSREVKAAKRDLDSLSASAGRAEGSASSLGRTMAKAFAAIGLTKIAMDIVSANVEFQRLSAALETATGSAQAADAAFGTIREFASTTPYQLTEVTTAFLKLKNLGLDPSMEALQSYGNTASSMGKGINDMIEAVADASTNEFERLKEFGIKAKQQADTVTFTFQGVETTVAKNSTAIQQYLLDIGNTQFAGGMERQMDTLGGRLSNLKDNIFNFYVALGQTGAADKLKAAIDLLNQAIVGLTNNVGVAAAALGVLAVRLAAVRAQMTLSAITAYLGQVIALNRALGATSARAALFSASLKGVQRSFMQLTAAMAVNPFVAIATGISAVIALLYTYRNENIKVGENTVTIGNIFAGVWSYIQKVIQVVQKIFSEGWAEALGSIAAPLRTVGGWFDALGDFIYGFVNRTIGRFAGLAAAVKALFTDESFTDAFNRAYNADYIGMAGNAIGDLAVHLNDVGAASEQVAEASDDAAPTLQEMTSSVANLSEAIGASGTGARDRVREFSASIEEFNRETARQRNAIGLTYDEFEIYNNEMERNARIAAAVSLATEDNTDQIRELVAETNRAYNERRKVIEQEQEYQRSLDTAAAKADQFAKQIEESRREQEEFNYTLSRTVGLLDNLFGLNGDLLTVFESDAFKGLREAFGGIAKEFANMFDKSLKEVFAGAEMGAAMGRMFAGISDAAGLPSSKTGGQIGGAVGSLFGPTGAAVGSIVGSLSVGLLKGTKKASATIETLASNEVQVSIQGNSKKLKEVADSMATSVIDGLMDIADAFGGSLLEGIQISIGQRNKKFVVDPTGMGRTKGSGVEKFKDEEAAIAYATKLALENGVITGIRDTTQGLLRAGDDLKSALQDALDFENVFDRLLEKTDPLAFSLQQLEEEFDRLTALFDKAGASAAEYADLQQLYELERQEILDKAAQEQLDKQHEITNMIVRLYEEQGLAAEALALTRQMELDKANETEKAILRQIYAVEDFNKARAEETQELESTIQTMQQLSDSLRAFRDSLYAADGGVTNYRQALVDLMQVGSLAATGDTQALAALQGTSQTFLEASRSRAASAFEYQKDVALVARYVDQGIEAADQQVSAAEQQLTLLEEQLAQLVGLNGNIESLIEATTTPVSAPNSGMVYDWNENIASNSGTEERLDQMDGTLRDHLYAIAKNTNATAKLLDRWDGDGQPDIRELSSDYY